MPGFALNESQITDLTVTTLKQLGRGKFEQIAQTVQEHHAFSKIFKEEKVQEDDGYALQWDLMPTFSKNFRSTGLYAKDNINVQDNNITGTVPWRHQTTGWLIERREVLENAGPSRIVDLIKQRRIDCMIGIAEGYEQLWWGKPADSTDNVTLFGVLYWFVYNATEGFNGGNATGFTGGPAGVDCTTQPNWKHWTANYANVSKQDLIKKMRRAYRKTQWRSPVDIPDFRRGSGQDYGYYMNENTLLALEDLGEAQNENIGRDLATFDGTMTFKRHSLNYVPYLDALSTSNPIYGINWSYFFPVFLRGDYMRESKPIWLPDRHNTQVVYMDNTMNTKCVDRRRQQLFAIADPALGV